MKKDFLFQKCTMKNFKEKIGWMSQKVKFFQDCYGSLENV